jgi:hypothetical protein
MVEYLSLLDPSFLHVFVSAFHRLSDSCQREELADYNIVVYSIHNRIELEKCLGFLSDNKDKRILVHLDESDYGSGSKQLLSEVWYKASSDIHFILYSATPYEVDYSEQYCVAAFEPPSTYCGSERFLSERLVYEANEFFTQNGLSSQGQYLIDKLIRSTNSGSGRNVAVLRLKGTTDGESRYEAFRSLSERCDELKEVDIIFDKSGAKEIVQWSSERWWKRQSDKVPILIVVEYKSSRSTEWKCHDRIAWTHCLHSERDASTILQSDLRCAHYSTNYGGVFQPIEIFTFKAAFEWDAGRITTEEYANRGGTLSPRVLTSVKTSLPVSREYFPCPEKATAEQMWRLGKQWAEERLRQVGIRHEFRENRFRQFDGKHWLAYVRVRVRDGINAVWKKLAKNHSEYLWGVENASRLEPVYEGEQLFLELLYVHPEAEEHNQVVIETAASSMYAIVSQHLPTHSTTESHSSWCLISSTHPCNCRIAPRAAPPAKDGCAYVIHKNNPQKRRVCGKPLSKQSLMLGEQVCCVHQR